MRHPHTTHTHMQLQHTQAVDYDLQLDLYSLFPPERLGYSTCRRTNWQALPSEVATLIHPHPTMSEAVGEAHLALAGKPLHSHA